MDNKIMADMIKNHQACVTVTNDKGEVKEIHLRPKAVEESLADKLQQEDINKGSSIVSRITESNNMKINLCSACTDVHCVNHGKGLRSLPTGTIDAKVMFINKQPTEYEAAQGTCCCDRNGMFISLILDKINVSRDSIYFTDMIKCPVQLDESSFNTCIDTYLKLELTMVAPQIIICNSLSVLKTCIARNIIKNLPSNVSYGNIYNAELFNGQSVKITAIYDLDTVLQKSEDDYNKCKNDLWSQVLNAFKAL
jgi:uracil-DNA glycosylase family 4